MMKNTARRAPQKSTAHPPRRPPRRRRAGRSSCRRRVRLRRGLSSAPSLLDSPRSSRPLLPAVALGFASSPERAAFRRPRAWYCPRCRDCRCRPFQARIRPRPRSRRVRPPPVFSAALRARRRLCRRRAARRGRRPAIVLQSGRQLLEQGCFVVDRSAQGRKMIRAAEKISAQSAAQSAAVSARTARSASGRACAAAASKRLPA